MLLLQVEGLLVVVDAGLAVRALVLYEVDALAVVVLVVLLVVLILILVEVMVMMAAAAVVVLLILVREQEFFNIAQVGVQLVDVLLGLVLPRLDGLQLLGNLLQRLQHAQDQPVLQGVLVEVHALGHAL